MSGPCDVILHPSSFILMSARRLSAMFVRATLVLAAVGASAPSCAQDYPSRPIRFIVGFVPGGVSDLLARSLGQELTEAWSQQVIVDNRAGAGGTISMQLAAKSVPDGYTLLLGSSTQFAITPA